MFVACKSSQPSADSSSSADRTARSGANTGDASPAASSDSPSVDDASAADSERRGNELPATEGPLRPDDDDPTEILFAYAASVGADEVMVDEQWVYWTNGLTAFRGKKSGKGAVTTFGPTGMWHATMQLAQDSEHVYWVADAQLVQTHKTTEQIRRFEIGDFKPDGGALFVKDGEAFVVDVGCLHLSIIDLTTGAVDVLEVSDADIQGAGANVIADGQDVYCTTGTTARVYRVQHESGERTQLATAADDREIVAISIDDSHLYWLDVPRSLAGEFAQQRLMRADKRSGADPEQLTVSSGNVTSRLVRANDTLYWIAGGVHRFDLASGEYRRLTELSANRADLALDDEYLYWLWPGYVYRANRQALEDVSTEGLPSGQPRLP